MASLFNHPLVTRNYLFPDKPVPKEPFYIESRGNKLACLYRRLQGSESTIIHFHGNAEVVADYVNSPLMALPCDILFAEYPGFGGSTGEPALAAMLDDVEAIVNAVERPREKVCLFGRSVGSLYALHAASLFPDIGGLVIESGIADIYERITKRVKPSELGVSAQRLQEEAKKYFDHEAKIKAFKGRTLILHAFNDSLVPRSHAIRLLEWANNPKYHFFEWGDHNSILKLNRQKYLDHVESLLIDL